jgi:hypothetical protein
MGKREDEEEVQKCKFVIMKIWLKPIHPFTHPTLNP